MDTLPYSPPPLLPLESVAFTCRGRRSWVGCGRARSTWRRCGRRLRAWPRSRAPGTTASSPSAQYHENGSPLEHLPWPGHEGPGLGRGSALGGAFASAPGAHERKVVPRSPDANAPAAVVGGQDRGTWVRLAIQGDIHRANGNEIIVKD